MDRPITTLFMLMSVDGKISTFLKLRGFVKGCINIMK